MRISLEKRETWKWYALLTISIIAAYSAVWFFTKKTPWMHSAYDPYTLQAQRWLSGYLDLGQNYSYLELAIYKGKYYVSFPPLPTLFVLPFVLILGVDRTPEYLITTVVSIIGAIQLFRLFLLYCGKEKKALLWALLATIGSNFLLIGYNGDVWLMAQTCGFMFTSASLYYAATDTEKDGRWPLLWLACAVGCRPLNIVYLPVVAVFLMMKFQKNGLSLWDALKKHWTWLIAPTCVGCAYMLLNVLRFDNPFQFGHDYLPEFTSSPDHVQFSFVNIQKHFSEKLFGMPSWSEDGTLRFSKGGFAFFITSPIFALGFLFLVMRVLKAAINHKSLPGWRLLLVGVCISAHLLLLCAHGSMGGIQWGLRYTIDAIPAACLGIALLMNREKEDRIDNITDFLLQPTLIFGLCLNLVGTLAILNGWDIFL